MAECGESGEGEGGWGGIGILGIGGAFGIEAPGSIGLLDAAEFLLVLRDAVLAGPESRGSSPVRIDRDPDTRESPGIRGLYPVGEGAGYAGGIVSAAVDGLRTAKAIVARYATQG